MRPFLRKLSAANVGPYLAAWHRREDAIAYEPHFHREYEVAFIVRGQGVRHVGDSIEAYSGGDLLLTAPSLPHTYEASPLPDGTQHEQIVVHFDSALFSEEARSHPCMQATGLLLKDAHQGLCFSPAICEQVAGLITQIPELPPLRRLAHLLEVLHLLTGDEGRRTLSQKSFLTRKDLSEPLDRTSEYLNRNFTQNITVAKAASMAGMSPAAFARAFRRATGRTLITYLNEMRLRKACGLLLETERTIAEVATASGFDNVGYFNRRFLAAFGTRPKEYRRNGPSTPPRQVNTAR